MNVNITGEKRLEGAPGMLITFISCLIGMVLPKSKEQIMKHKRPKDKEEYKK